MLKFYIFDKQEAFYSELREIFGGLSQGSIFGPLLYDKFEIFLLISLLVFPYKLRLRFNSLLFFVLPSIFLRKDISVAFTLLLFFYVSVQESLPHIIAGTATFFLVFPFSQEMLILWR